MNPTWEKILIRFELVFDNGELAKPGETLKTDNIIGL
jgi:hypothetical protein